MLEWDDWREGYGLGVGWVLYVLICFFCGGWGDGFEDVVVELFCFDAEVWDGVLVWCGVVVSWRWVCDGG